MESASVNQWLELEPTKGVYYCSFLDEETARAERAGKNLLVRILSEGQSTPPWVFNEGVRVYPFGSRNPWGQAVGK
jgi:hypothetical protein